MADPREPVDGCCPFARSGGFHGEDCTYSGKSHCPYRMVAEGLHIVTAKRQAVLERIAKYAREDRAATPGCTRLARALDEWDAERARRVAKEGK